jgi:hypothetical protein
MDEKLFGELVESIKEAGTMIDVKKLRERVGLAVADSVEETSTGYHVHEVPILRAIVDELGITQESLSHWIRGAADYPGAVMLSPTLAKALTTLYRAAYGDDQ